MLSWSVAASATAGGVVTCEHALSPSESPRHAALPTCRTPAGSGESTTTPNDRLALPPAASSPTARDQGPPAPGPGAHDQPGELAAAANVVWAGTVSTITAA